MMATRVWGLSIVLASACGDDSGLPPLGVDTGAMATADASGSSTATSTTANDGIDDDGTVDDGVDATTQQGSSDGPDDTTGPAPPAGLPELGSLVVLGDSISDGGGMGPFYYDLLAASLEAHYGSITYENAAESGSETDALVGQIASLPDVLPGPVAVVITSGGNDMKASIAAILAGSDGPARMQMQDNVAAAHAALQADGRFGDGVEVFVFEGNIYDASDGVGDYGDNGCAFGQGLPAVPTNAYFASWNGAIETAVVANVGTYVDMHAHFVGHGYASAENWYAPDCTHPNTLGHAALQELFHTAITGLAP